MNWQRIFILIAEKINLAEFPPIIQNNQFCVKETKNTRHAKYDNPVRNFIYAAAQ